MTHVIRHADLPRLQSTRDGRDRIDLVTEDMWGFTDLQADHITYRPGDTAAAHYHVGARHMWFIDAGRAELHVGDEMYEVAKGDVATAGDGEIHWFVNTGEVDVSFYELWVPAPTETVWIRDDDI